jgi:hypothetical protein
MLPVKRVVNENKILLKSVFFGISLEPSGRFKGPEPVAVKNLTASLVL